MTQLINPVQWGKVFKIRISPKEEKKMNVHFNKNLEENNLN